MNPVSPARVETHVCLVSSLVTPNLAPLLDDDFRPTQRVVLVVAPDQRERADWLTEVLRPRGLQVERLEVADAWNLPALIDTFLEWLAARAPTETLALNFSGGTRPMAMAAQTAFLELGRQPVFCVHPQTDEVVWLAPRQAALPLANRVRLPDYLRAHGWSVMAPPDRSSVPRERAELAVELAARVDEFAAPIGTLNWYASQCDAAGSLDIELEDRDLRRADLARLLERFAAAGALQLESGRLTFPDEAARFYCNGGWLEEHVAAVLGAIARECGVQDWAAGLRVKSSANRLSGNAASNELDLAFLADNRLHLVECKTAAFAREDSAAAVVYKLDALTALGELDTRCLLVSYRPLRDGDRQRARDLGIRTVVGGEIAELRARLAAWIRRTA